MRLNVSDMNFLISDMSYSLTIARTGMANWAGRMDGDMERFGDNIRDDFDEGRDEGRNDDGW